MTLSKNQVNYLQIYQTLNTKNYLLLNEFPQKCTLHSIKPHQTKSRIQQNALQGCKQKQKRRPVGIRH